MAPPLVARVTDDVIPASDHNDVKSYIEDGTYRTNTAWLTLVPQSGGTALSNNSIFFDSADSYKLKKKNNSGVISAITSLTDVDRITSISATAGDTIILTSDGTNLTLTGSRGRLNITPVSGGINIPTGQLYMINGTGHTHTIFTGHILVGAGTTLDPSPRTDAIVTIAEDASDNSVTLRRAMYLVPILDKDLAGGDFNTIEQNIFVGSGLESTDGLTTTSREHWNDLYDGDAVAPDGFSSVGGTNYFSQTFMTGVTRHYINNVVLEVYGSGSPGTITVQIKAVDGANKPTGGVLSSGTYSTTITIDPAGEAIVVPVSKFLPSASTQYAIVVFQSASSPNLVNWLSDSLQGYASGLAWSSTDSGSTWATVAVDFMFAVAGSQASTTNNLRMQYAQLAGSTAGNSIGTLAKVAAFDISLNPGFSGVLAVTNLVGYDVTTLNTTPAPTRSYGIRINSAGNGTTAWGINSNARIQLNSATGLVLGGTATTLGINSLQRHASVTTAITMTLNSVIEYDWRQASFAPVSAATLKTLGLATNQGWGGLYLQDTSATFTNEIISTSSTPLNANRTLTIDLANGSRTLKISGDSTINQDTSTGGSPTFIGATIAVNSPNFLTMNYARTGASAFSFFSNDAGGVNSERMRINTGTNVVQIRFFSTDLDLNGQGILGLSSLTLNDGASIIGGTTTGFKIGTGATQKIGFYDATPVVQNTGWSATNVTTDTAFDANATSLDEVADVLGTLINQLKTYGILGA